MTPKRLEAAEGRGSTEPSAGPNAAELDAERRLARLREHAPAFLEAVLTNVEREYPHQPLLVVEGPDDLRPHRELHPAFFGCYDWHSAVEMHWAAVRILRLVPDLPPGMAAKARATLDRRLTPANLAAETAFFARSAHRGVERPYGWGWLFTLQAELRAWAEGAAGDPDAAGWADAIEPLARLLSGRLVDWLPKLAYPQRVGMHANTAFGLSRALGWASGHDAVLAAAIGEAAHRLFGRDRDAPVAWEPSGADFLSPVLCEAALMSQLQRPSELTAWLSGFLPALAAGPDAWPFRPVAVTDVTDGQLAHLHGLNLSRAWALAVIAAQLRDDDDRVPAMLSSAAAHVDASLPQVTDSDYMAEHWLAAFAVLALGVGGRDA